MPMKPREIIVNDRMQIGYRYLLTKPGGRCFHPDFRPELTPKQMLELGVFGGKYMTDCRDEFPHSWFRKAKLSPLRVNPILNYFGVGASKPLSYWVEKGWIHPQDPRGWFQWYCRYYLGRRSEGAHGSSDGVLGMIKRKSKRGRAHRLQATATLANSDLACQVF